MDTTLDDRGIIVFDHYYQGYHKCFGDSHEHRCSNMCVEWYNERGQLHRKDGSAVIGPDDAQDGIRTTSFIVKADRP